VLLLVLIVVAPLALIVVGYRDLSAALSPQAARGLLSLTIGMGLIVWLLSNLN
jgi:hypothetical protein